MSVDEYIGLKSVKCQNEQLTKLFFSFFLHTKNTSGVWVGTCNTAGDMGNELLLQQQTEKEPDR
jgi:hypothetical protein